jgi:hypothetical protein
MNHPSVNEATRRLTEAIERSIHIRMRLDAITHHVREKVLQHSDAVVVEAEHAMAAVAQEIRRCREELAAAEAAEHAAAHRPTKLAVQLERCARFAPALYERWQQEQDDLKAAIAAAERDPYDWAKADAAAKARTVFANTTRQILTRTFPPEEVPVA